MQTSKALIINPFNMNQKIKLILSRSIYNYLQDQDINHKYVFDPQVWTYIDDNDEMFTILLSYHTENISEESENDTQEIVDCKEGNNLDIKDLESIIKDTDSSETTAIFSEDLVNAKLACNNKNIYNADDK